MSDISALQAASTVLDTTAISDLCAVEPVLEHQAGVGLRTTRAIPAHGVILAIPESALIPTPATCSPSHGTQILQAIHELVSAAGSTAHASRAAYAAAILHAPASSPCERTPPESHYHASYARFVAARTRAYQQYCSTFGVVPEQQFSAAWQAWYSRAMRPGTSQGQQECFVPGLDLANHAHNGNAHFSTVVHHGVPCVALVAGTAGLAAGASVRICYGHMPNVQWLLQHGFAQERYAGVPLAWCASAGKLRFAPVTIGCEFLGEAVLRSACIAGTGDGFLELLHAVIPWLVAAIHSWATTLACGPVRVSCTETVSSEPPVLCQGADVQVAVLACAELMPCNTRARSHDAIAVAQAQTLVDMGLGLPEVDWHALRLPSQPSTWTLHVTTAWLQQAALYQLAVQLLHLAESASHVSSDSMPPACVLAWQADQAALRAAADNACALYTALYIA